jgi:Type IV secretion-system coupling protein DNA-binding domain
LKWHDIDHGAGSLIFGYAVVAITMLVGLWRGRAGWRKYLALPILAIPTLIAGALVTSAVGLVWNPGPRGTTRYMVAEIMAYSILAFVGFLAGQLIARSVPNRSHQRGTRVIDGTTAQRRAGGSSLKFGGIPVRDLDETKHFKLIGTTGTGKSTAIRALLAGALERGDRAVIADPDGGYVERFYDPKRGDVILSPFDQRSK